LNDESQPIATTPAKRPILSLDVAAVLLAFALALLVRSGLLSNIPW